MQLIQVVLQIAKYQSIAMLDSSNPYKSRRIIAAQFLILSETLHARPSLQSKIQNTALFKEYDLVQF